MHQAQFVSSAPNGKELTFSYFRLHEKGLTPLGIPTFEEWVYCGRFLQEAEQAVQFWIGDWLLFGEKTYGKTNYAEAIQQTGLEYQTLRDYKWVASAVPVAMRNEKLSFHHHREVASLPQETQAHLLNKAISENWPLLKLKQEKYQFHIKTAQAAPVS